MMRAECQGHENRRAFQRDGLREVGEQTGENAGTFKSAELSFRDCLAFFHPLAHANMKQAQP